MRVRLPSRRRTQQRWPTIGLIIVAAGLLPLVGWIVVDRTTLDGSGPVTGVIPDAMPEDFPIPAGAEIGESTVDDGRIRTTVYLTLRGSLAEAVSAHTVGLVSSGYVVGESHAEGDGWVIRFSRLDLRGTIELTPADGGVASRITVVDP